MALVSVVGCGEYRDDLLRDAIMAAAARGGLDFTAFAGKRVALKPNLLVASKAGSGVITDLRFFRAAAGLVRDHGGTCVVAESPSIQSLETVMRKTGYLDAARGMGIAVASDADTAEVRWEGARRYRSAEVIKGLLDVDIVLNLPKCKTHSLTYFTGAVKNLFGLVPGMRKSRMHLKAPGVREFSEYLLDLYGILLHGLPNRPAFLHIMDAVVGLEGEGPGSPGTPAKLGAVIAGVDALAVDLAAVRTAGLEEKKVPTLELGYRRRYGITSPEELRVDGDFTRPAGGRPFRPAGTSFLSRSVRWPRAFRAVKNLVVEKPVPMEGPCTLCYQCRAICPAGAITPAGGGKKAPVYDYGLCVRCFCCLEVCPEAAIAKKRGKLQWITGR